MRKCGKCGQSGHNARTCGKGPKPVKVSGKRKCGVCGKKGHNARTCPSKTEEPKIVEQEIEEQEEEIEEVFIKKPKKRRSYKCPLCDEVDDHRESDCPYTPLPEGKEVGPRMMECNHWSWWLSNGVCEQCVRSKKINLKPA
jgi:hypothetical protein